MDLLVRPITVYNSGVILNLTLSYQFINMSAKLST